MNFLTHLHPHLPSKEVVALIPLSLGAKSICIYNMMCIVYIYIHTHIYEQVFAAGVPDAKNIHVYVLTHTQTHTTL